MGSIHQSLFFIRSAAAALAVAAAAVLMPPATLAQPLRLVAPNGGERLRVGSTTTIRWQGVTAADTVKLEYSIDNGATWMPITDKGTGLQYQWVGVPNTPSTRCLMRVSMSGSTGDSVLYLKSTRGGSPIPDAVHYAEFSPDGSRVIGGGAEGDVFIWDSFTGQIIRTVPVESRANVPSPPAPPGITLISSVRYSPDGRFFATTSPLPDSAGSMVRIFDANTGAKLREWRDVGQAAASTTEPCSYSPDGTRLLTGNVGGGRIYDAATGALVVTLKGYVAPFNVASMIDGDWNAGGTPIVGVSNGGLSTIPDVVISDPLTGDTIHTYSYSGTGSFSTVRFNPAGTRFITTADGGGVRVYDAVTGALIKEIHDYATFPTSAAFSNNGTQFATTGQDLGSPNWKLHLYDAATGGFIRTVGAIINGMRTVDFSPDDARILTSCVDGVRIFHAPQGTVGQSDVSDSLWEIYIDSNASVVVAAPVVTARQGEQVDVPITISDAAAALGTGATRIDLTLHYNVSMLAPAGTTPAGTVTAKDRAIPLSFPIPSGGDSVLGVLHFIAALGDDSTTVLDVSGATSDRSSLSVTTRNGLFRLADLCREGGARLLNPNGVVMLKVVSSSTTGAGLDAELETVEAGRTTLTLCDLAGRSVRCFTDGEAPSGRWRLHLDVAGVPQGRYFLVLSTPTARRTVALEVVR